MRIGMRKKGHKIIILSSRESYYHATKAYIDTSILLKCFTIL